MQTRNPCGEITLTKRRPTILGFGAYIYTVRIQAANGVFYTIPVTLSQKDRILHFRDHPILVAELAAKIGQRNFGGIRSIDMGSIKQVRPKWPSRSFTSISTLLKKIKFILLSPQQLRSREQERK